MSADNNHRVETARSTVPQHVIDRFENEWQQMRTNASVQAKPAHQSADKR